MDAIRWCLGEQSMRDLRGQRAEDVIYAGPRHVMGVAEVSLTFASGAATPSGSPDLAIQRRLYRSGESEYLVDGRKTRLRDVLDRLREIGIDGSRHIVVTQGMADALLSASPIERRSLLEGAAGLSGYRVRRDEAKQKLATTEQNIATILVLLEEIEPRLRILKRQARAVQDRDESQALLRKRLEAWYSAAWARAQADISIQDRAVAEASLERLSLQQRLRELEEAVDADLNLERVWQQRIEMTMAAHRSAEREHEAAVQRRSEAERELQVLRDQQTSVESRVQRSRAVEVTVADRMRRTVETVDDLKRSVAELEAREREIRCELQLAKEQKAPQEADLAARVEERKDVERQLTDSRRQLDALIHNLELAQKNQAEAEAWVGSAQTQLRRLEEDASHAEAQLGALRARATHLQEMARDREHSAVAARAREARLHRLVVRMRHVQAEVDRRGQTVRRTVQLLQGELGDSLIRRISVDPGWETAISAALGDWSLVTDSADGAAWLHPWQPFEVLAWRENLRGRIQGALWADTVASGLPEGRANPLPTTLLARDASQARAWWSILAPLPALTIGTPPLQIVSRDGQRWSAIGVERAPAGDRAARYLVSRRELEGVEQRGRIYGRRRERLEDALAKSRTGAAEVEADVARVLDGARSSRLETIQTEETIGRLNHRIADLAEQKMSRERQQALAAEAVARLTKARADLQAAVVELEARLSLLEDAVSEARARLEAGADAHGDLAREYEEVHRNYVALASRKSAQEDVLAASQAELARLREEIDLLADEGVDVGRRIGSARELLGECTASAEQLHAVLAEHTDRLSTVRLGRPSANGRRDELRGLRAAVTDAVAAHERAEALAVQAHQRARDLAVEIQRELGFPPGLLPAFSGEAPDESEIRRLRARAAQYADAETSVVEEARELGERHSYLSQHVDDLRSAADTVRDMMYVADEEMKSRFDEAFTAVSDEFSRIFAVMLPGGRASLHPTGDGTGVEIVAQMPGKRSRSSAAFSGGERSLIASSLLFGVLRIRPAPFCVLDEVDAALDERNVDRYLAALRDITQNTQAIVVTHNRATMAAADALYGMTMDSEGVSNVLSLRLDTYQAV